MELKTQHFYIKKRNFLDFWTHFITQTLILFILNKTFKYRKKKKPKFDAKRIIAI